LVRVPKMFCCFLNWNKCIFNCFLVFFIGIRDCSAILMMGGKLLHHVICFRREVDREGREGFVLFAPCFW
jgi:hypothetical protein